MKKLHTGISIPYDVLQSAGLEMRTTLICSAARHVCMGPLLIARRLAVKQCRTSIAQQEPLARNRLKRCLVYDQIVCLLVSETDVVNEHDAT
jgi:hypothetical protein